MPPIPVTGTQRNDTLGGCEVKASGPGFAAADNQVPA